MILRPSLRLCLLGAALGTAARPPAALAQGRAEVELERARGTTTSRVEVYDGASPLLRVERELRDSATQRVGALIPARAVGLDGYVSLFLEDRADGDGYGAAFELGRGVPMVGASVQRNEHDYVGAYLKLRRPNAELGLGGGDRDGGFIQHGALYLKGARWSAALGGAHGPAGADFQHFAASWHPMQRGGAPGARLIAERRNAGRYFAELMVADRANFNHFAVWGQYGMDQWPHTKSFEAVDDITRYVRPPIFEQQYTAGAGIVRGRYELKNGVREITLDGRAYPMRLLHRPAVRPVDDPRTGISGYVVDRVLPNLMVGGFRALQARANTWVGEIDLPPFALYGEVPPGDAEPYLFLQYRQDLPFF